MKRLILFLVIINVAWSSFAQQQQQRAYISITVHSQSFPESGYGDGHANGEKTSFTSGSFYQSTNRLGSINNNASKEYTVVNTDIPVNFSGTAERPTVKIKATVGYRFYKMVADSSG